MISPLNELSATTYADVRQKQVDCVLQLLHSSGDSISFGWPLFLNIIGAISNTQRYLPIFKIFDHTAIHNASLCYLLRDNLIRSAFQCLQLVVTDYMPILPWNCLPQAVETTGKFGSQTQELNVALTAIGLMVT